MAILSRLLRPRASLENPSFKLTDPEAFDYLGASETTSGVRVNRETALQYGPWFRGIVLIASSVGKLPLHILKRVGEGKVRDPQHEAYRVLRRKPNPYQTAFIFRQQLTGHAVSTGNGYAYIHRDRGGRPLELWPLDPDKTTPVLADGEPWYVAELPSGEQRKLPGVDVLHIRGYNFDGITGYSVWDLAREDLGTSMAQRDYRGKLYSSGARPGVVLQTSQKLTKPAADELRNTWDSLHAGLNRSHRTSVLHSGVEAKVVSYNPDETKLNDSEKFSLIQIANFLGVPPHKIGSSERTAYNSLENENQSFIDDCLDPWLVLWEEETADKLLTEEQKDNDTHVVEFVREALVRGDLAARASYYEKATGRKAWMKVDEVRSRENLNPLDEELDTPPEPAAPPASEPTSDGDSAAVNDLNKSALRDAAQAVLEDAAGRMLRRLAHAGERAARDPDQYLAWLEHFAAEHRDVITDAFKPAVSVLRAIPRAIGPSDLADELLRSAGQALAELAEQHSARQLPTAVSSFVDKCGPHCIDQLVAVALGTTNEERNSP